MITVQGKNKSFGVDERDRVFQTKSHPQKSDTDSRNITAQVVGHELCDVEKEPSTFILPSASPQEQDPKSQTVILQGKDTEGLVQKQDDLHSKDRR